MGFVSAVFHLSATACLLTAAILIKDTVAHSSITCHEYAASDLGLAVPCTCGLIYALAQNKVQNLHAGWMHGCPFAWLPSDGDGDYPMLHANRLSPVATCAMLLVSLISAAFCRSRYHWCRPPTIGGLQFPVES